MNTYTSAGVCRSKPAFDRGALLRTGDPVYVIGAVNIDITGIPAAELRHGDSNPGRVALFPGGVGRNIAENLRLLGRRVSLVTITGDDTYGSLIREHCRNAGIDMQFSITDPQGRTSTYLCVNEADGDIYTAIADMGIYERLTPDRLEPLLPVLNKGAMLITEANLPEETLAWLAEHITIPIAADPVSAAKAERLRPLLPKLTLLKPNVQETELLTGMEIRGDGDLGRAADALHRMGVRRVYISLGARGVWADDAREGSGMVPCFPGVIVNTTGCGDAFVAAAADAFLGGLNTRDAAVRALAAAAVCAADSAAVNPRLNRETIDLTVSGKL